MASLSTDPRGNRRIQFTAADRRRRSIRLGKVSKRAAETVAGMVERLNAAALAGHVADDHTARWVAELPDAMHAKLAAVGLVPARSSGELAPFLDAYVEARRTDAKPGTVDHLTRVAADLVDFFGPGRGLRSVTPGDADEFRRHLAGRLGDNTVRRRIGRAKQFFNVAVRKELIGRNPFDGLPTQVRGNPERSFFLTAEDAARVLEACPDVQWRLIFALARWGGLRCPSELLPLTWADVDWDRGRLRVTSPKTEHHEGGGSRVVPLFPELRPHLAAAFDAAAPGELHVVTRCRSSRVNLRQQFQRIVRRAGLTPWPKLFHNLRATRQTELAATFPMHVVCDWIGNTIAVAGEHYLTTTDADYRRAIAEPPTGAGGDGRGADSGARGADAVQIATRQAAAGNGTPRKMSPEGPTLAALTPAVAAGCRPLPALQTPRVGFEPTT